MDSHVIYSRLFRLFAIAAAVAMSTSVSSAQSVDTGSQTDLIQTAASKSETDNKPKVDPSHPLFKLLEVAYKARDAMDNVEDYRCVFTKKELLRNNRLLSSTMQMKFREKPFSVYLSFVNPDPNAGREVIFVQGRNNNNFLVHEGGIKSVAGTFKLDTAGPDAMAENKYPITQIGMKNMIQTVIKLWEAEGKFEGIKTQWRTAKIDQATFTAYEAVHQQFKEFKFHTTRLYVDDATGLAIGVQQYGFPSKKDQDPPLVEEYFYRQLKVNQKLSDADFDPKNPNYAFK